jgi:hypothetical protein
MGDMIGIWRTAQSTNNIIKCIQLFSLITALTSLIERKTLDWSREKTHASCVQMLYPISFISAPSYHEVNNKMTWEEFMKMIAFDIDNSTAHDSTESDCTEFDCTSQSKENLSVHVSFNQDGKLGLLTS